MKEFRLDEIAFDWKIQRRALPFEFRGESCPRPIGISVGFEITDVRDRLGFNDGAQTRQCEIPPRTVPFYPVKRRVPALFVHSYPTERQPKFRPVVAVLLDKRDVFAICNQPRCQRKRGNECLMPRPFVVVEKSVALMADLSGSLFKIDKVVGTPRCGVRKAQRGVRTNTKYRVERVLRQHVFDVCDEQFLMLLFMMESKDQNRFYFIEQTFVRI